MHGQSSTTWRFFHWQSNCFTQPQAKLRAKDPGLVLRKYLTIEISNFYSIGTPIKLFSTMAQIIRKALIGLHHFPQTNTHTTLVFTHYLGRINSLDDLSCKVGLRICVRYSKNIFLSKFLASLQRPNRRNHWKWTNEWKKALIRLHKDHTAYNLPFNVGRKFVGWLIKQRGL